MAERSFDAEAYVGAAAALIGLPIDPAQMAALVMEFPLPDEAEPAPVFRP
jgi:hypothetical protein